ncbi:sugar nucleotide-binding protein [Conchiformibius kuhniae]|uniref:Sugar nucleotide-binding protein n=1 Tax=Conchiformibius kuhniae TaxID=211502 RepID=A0A8T9MTP2_9NEIS|nr:sugar nucleotide-binding protein [Conchiformibius kuhniae]UOP04464.1 sugar nucleotide-binding protein [Conchiformibius kuhniae]
MNTLIFGFGFLGRPLAEALWQRGTPVRAVKRRLTSDDINLPFELDTLALTPDSFLPAWADCRAWVFLLPPAPLPDYAATIGALARTAAHCGAAQLVFGSSISVYGDRARECNEHSPPEPATASAQAIVAAEQACLASGVANIDILRFGGLYAAERHPVHSLLKRQNNTGANRPVNMVHRDLAVAALLRALDTPNGVRVRNIVEPAHPRKAAFYAAEAAKLGLPAPHFADHDDGAGKTVRSAYRDLV